MPIKNESLLFLLFLFAMPFAMPLFSHEANINIEGESRYKSVRLTPEIYNAAHRNLSDLLIKNPGGENVPYFINSRMVEKNMKMETYLMRLINSYRENDYFFFDYTLAVARNSDVIATSLEFSTGNTGFAKHADIFGSYDNINWEFVQSDMLYSVEGKSKPNINFRQPQKYTHYRLRFTNNFEQIYFNNVNLVYNLETSVETFFIESFIPEFKVETEDKKTKILIEGLKNLRLCDLQIETDSMFIRKVSSPAGVKELYNLSVNGTSYTDALLPLHMHIPESETFTVIINDADDKPVNITGISARYYADDLVFQGNAGDVYRLEFGADPARAAPVYDIERYKNEILMGSVDRLALGGIIYVQPQSARRDAFSHRIIFNIVVTVIGIMLAVLIVLKLKKRVD